jgi:hypothetical protein
MPHVEYKSPEQADEQHVRKVNQAKGNLERQIAEAVGVPSSHVHVSAQLSKPRQRLQVKVIITDLLPLRTRDDLKAIVAEQVKGTLEGSS